MGWSKQIYRSTFVAAAIYNGLFGLWAGFFPEAFFHLMEMSPPRYPAIWKYLGMMIGLYGIVYLWAAYHLDQADLFIAVGLIVKMLGPFGVLLTIRSGEWPARTYSLSVVNDLIWWVPFALFLLRNRRFGTWVQAAAPWICLLLNGIAVLFFSLFLLPGTEIAADLQTRLTFLERNTGLWRVGWVLWGAAALSLVGFFAWWASQLSYSRWTVAGLFTGGVGMCLDLIGGSIFIGWFPEYVEALEGTAMLLTAGLGNGLYAVAGILLTLSTVFSRVWLEGWTWGVWTTAFAFTIMAIFHSPMGMAITGSLMMVLFCPWVAVMGAMFDPQESFERV